MPVHSCGVPPVLIRPRRPGDVPALGAVLTAQRSSSRYPMRWPLPFPVEQFIVRDHELGAWTAERAGVPVGHVAIRAVTAGSDGRLAPEAQAWVDGTGRPPAELGVVSTLFTSLEQRGTGLGRRLHDTAVSALRETGRVPCLDVVPEHVPAVEVYRHLGWRTVGRCRPDWLPPGTGPVLAMVLD